MSETSAVEDAAEGAADGTRYEPRGPLSRVAANRVTIAALAPRVVGQHVRAALRALRDGEAYGTKAVLEPTRDELRALLGDAADAAYAEGERPNWKLSALVSINPSYGAVKIVGSHSYNRQHGDLRSTSTVLLYDKLTMQAVAILDGSTLSAQRTGAYASVVIDRLLSQRARFSVFLFGAGRVAQAVVEDLQAHHPERIDTLYIRSRTQASAEAFVAQLAPHVSFALVAAPTLDALPDCTLIVTASNANAPLFEAWQVGDASIILHLGGDETPDELIRYTLEAGTVICDDIDTVAHRRSQSLPLFFARTGRSLEAMANAYQVRNLWQIMDENTPYRLPALVTCVGLPVLDLYLAQHVYETARDSEACPG
ncbi:ornithine cyclodeaminase [Burkholderia pseudomallei]|uniref:ornithine cyclodeaminase n=1 Tax=Burkholderia pseudomallei TaxID=28450 RepID=UPI000F08951A|nr:ornithine cyclodeaminase [Burkholderia pseudomallei]VBD50735.1 ornithine cyclodeaminase [Burkholderia pseudomallei]